MMRDLRPRQHNGVQNTPLCLLTFRPHTNTDFSQKGNDLYLKLRIGKKNNKLKTEHFTCTRLVCRFIVQRTLGGISGSAKALYFLMLPLIPTNCCSKKQQQQSSPVVFGRRSIATSLSGTKHCEEETLSFHGKRKQYDPLESCLTDVCAPWCNCTRSFFSLQHVPLLCTFSRKVQRNGAGSLGHLGELCQSGWCQLPSTKENANNLVGSEPKTSKFCS